MDQKVDIIQTVRDVLTQEANALISLQQYVNEELKNAIIAMQGCSGHLIFTGIGKSALVAQKTVATLNSTGTPAIFLHTAEAFHGDLGIIQPNDVVCLVSNSGNTPELKELVPIIHNKGNITIAIAGNELSYIAQNCTFFIRTTVSNEACDDMVAPTNSTTAQIAMGDAIAMTLMKLKGFTNHDFAKLHPGGKLGKQLNLKIKDLFPHNTQPSVYEHASLKEVINTISSGRLGATAVIDNNNKILGIITDGDVRRMLQHTDSLSNITANDIYSRHPKYTTPDTMAIDALLFMQEKDITQLIVADEHGLFLGFVHIHDLIKEGL